MRMVVRGAYALMVAGVLVGCSPPTSGMGPSTAMSTTVPVASPAPGPVFDEDTGELVVPEQVPVWDAAARESAVAAAQTAMATFARPDLDAEAWWTGLASLLTVTAQSDYAYVDPAAVPAREVTGAGVVVDESSAYVARVQVPTDAGVYTVLLSRIDADAPWLTERFTPPEAGQ